MEQETRVKYFPPSDLACGLYLEKVEELYKNKDNLQIKDINDALEFYNIYLYFHDSKIHWKHWNKDEVEIYKQFSEDLKDYTFKYFFSICEDSFLSEISKVSSQYYSDFILLFEKSDLYKKISKNIFENSFQQKNIYLNYILQNKCLTNYFGHNICNILLFIPNGGEYIIRAADCEDNLSVTKIYLPNCITNKIEQNILEKYISEAKIESLNYISLLLDLPFKKQLPSTLIIKFVEKKKALEEEILSEKKELANFRIQFIRNQTELITIEQSANIKMDIKYNLDWILNNTDYPTLFNNFIYMFEFADEHMRINLPIEKMHSGLLDFLFENKNPKIYSINMISQWMESCKLVSLSMYRNILRSKNIQIENMIIWFYSTYLPGEFNVPEIKTHISSEKSYLEKCHELATNIDVIFKQFQCYIDYGKISFELLSVNSKPTYFENIGSLIKNKYVYGKEKTSFDKLCYGMFSDQCMLHYVERISNSYRSFYELLLHESVFVSDYPEYLHDLINFLSTFDLIEINSNQQILPKNIYRIQILYELDNTGFVSYYHFDKRYQAEIQSLEISGIVRFGSTILSKQEAEYFNYYLNDTFSNGPKLRNLYAHGIEYLNDNEDQHYNNYLVLLKLMILLIIKINDEFEIQSKQNNAQNNV